MCKVSIMANYNFQTELDLPNNESDFYKGIADVLVTLPVPNAVKVQSDYGKVDYTLSKRSGTLLIQEGFNSINIPDDGTEYPTVYLTCVDEEHNNYKFYKLEQKGNSVLATYGRIGSAKGELFGERNYTYEKRMFWIKYTEKISKGYVDKTHVYITPVCKAEEKKDVPATTKKKSTNPISKLLYDKLFAFAKNMVAKTVKSNIVITEGMIRESERLLELLYETKDINEFNSLLKELLAVSPRKVLHVDTLLACTNSQIPAIIQREEDLVAAMKATVGKLDVAVNEDDIFASEDISVKIATESQKKKVMEMLDVSLRGKVAEIYKVTPKKQKARFQKYVKDNNITELKSLWHGSRNQNWLSIIENGLLLNPNAIITGKMFGNGIYFAPGSRKSWNYTSYRNTYWAHGDSDVAFMGLYATAYGKPLDVYTAHSYNKNNINGKDCVHAHAGRSLLNDEIIFYDEAAMCLTYLVEFK